MPNPVASAKWLILAELVERVVLESVGYGRHGARITWIPLGQALRQRSGVAAA